MDTHDRKGGVFAPADEAAPYEDGDPTPTTYAIDDYASFDLPSPDAASVSGAELRRRLITPEVLAALEAEVPRPSLVERLLNRVHPRR
jgi:hypothetical protein